MNKNFFRDSRKVTVDGEPFAYISAADGELREIREKDFRDVHKQDRAKLLHVRLDAAHGARILDRHELGSQLCEAASLFMRLGDLCAEPRSLLVIVLLCLLAPLYDIIYPLVGGLAVSLTGIAAAPPVLHALLHALAGDEEWQGKHWTLRVPHIWSPQVPLGSFAPSADLRDYAALELRWRKRMLRLAAPCRNRLLVLESGVPAAVRKQLIKAAPLAVSVSLSGQPNGSGGHVLTLDGSSLSTYNAGLLHNLQNLADALSALILRFSAVNRQKPEFFRQRIAEQRQRFVPVNLVDGFTHADASAEAAVLSTLLAVGQEFLLWACEHECFTFDAASLFFRLVWTEILPESAPKIPDSPPKGTQPRLEDAAAFARFLAEYLDGNAAGIRPLGEAWQPHTVGLIRTVGTSPRPLLISEREPLFAAYREWLAGRDGDLSFADSVKPDLLPARLQGALAQAGVPFRDGGRDVTWKYAFWPVEVSKVKPACLGLPVDGLLALWERCNIEIGEAENRISVSEIAGLESQISRLKPSYQRQVDFVKGQLLVQLGTKLRRPFHALLKLCRERLDRFGAVDSDLLNEAGFDWDALDSFAEQLAKYAGRSADDWLDRLDALRAGHAIFAVGQEWALTIPMRVVPDISAGLRTFILSGSAALSPELSANPDLKVLEGKLEESYSRLTIHVQRTDTFAASKTAMKAKGNRKALAAWLRYRLSQLPQGCKVLAVTYKSYAAELWEELSAFHNRLIPLQSDDGAPPRPSLPYFGGMNGSNRYHEADCVICAGLGRFETADYLNRALAFDFDGKAWEELQGVRQKGNVRDAGELLCVKRAAHQTIARDLVQLVFRSTLRNHGGKTPVALWLVQPPNEVVTLVTAFFDDCTVVEHDDLPEACMLEAAAYRTVNGRPTHAARLLQWLKGWDGTEMPVPELQRTLGMSSAQWKEARKNETVRSFFDRHILSRRVGKLTLIRSENALNSRI